ncbi:hypothetical protein ACFLSA_04575, partial [Bacteroidota bacterium]
MKEYKVLVIVFFVVFITARLFAGEVFWGLSYYTTESEAILYVEEQSEGIMNLIIEDEVGSVLHRQDSIAISTGLNKILVNLNSIPAGEYRTIVECNGKDTVILSKLVPLVEGKEVKVDRYNRSVLVEGEPFFPFGMVIQGNTPEYITQEGFNTVVRWWYSYSCRGNESITPEQSAKDDALFREAKKYGFMVIDRPSRAYEPDPDRWEPGDPTDVNDEYVIKFNDWMNNYVPEILSVTKHHPQLLSNMGFDEPGGDLLIFAKKSLQGYHENDPYHPAFTNHNHGKGIWRELDLETALKLNKYDDLICDYIYWGLEGRGFSINEFARKTANFARLNNKPMWVMPMNEMHGSGQHVPMTPQEQFANTYIMMVNSATGIFYFWWPSYHRTHVEHFKQLSREIDTLKPALLRRPVEQSLNYLNSNEFNLGVIFTLRTLPDGTPVIVFVNIRDYVVEFTCEMPWLTPGSFLEPLVERGVQAPVINNMTFSESLEPLATRAYKISGHTIPDIEQVHEINISEVHPEDINRVSSLIEDPGFNDEEYWNIA